MKINIKAIAVDLTPSLRTYIENKLAPLSKFIKKFDSPGEVEIWLEVSRATRHHRHGDVFRAAADLRLDGKILRAEEQSSDIRLAVNLVRNTLRLEAEKYKMRLIETKKRGSVR